MSVCTYPNDVLVFIFQQTKYSGADIGRLYDILYFLVGLILQLDQAAALKSDIVIILFLYNGGYFPALMYLRFEINDIIFLLAIQVIFIESVSTVYEIEQVIFS